MLLVQGRNFRQNMAGFQMCQLAVLGSQGIVVNVQPPSFFLPWIDGMESNNQHRPEPGWTLCDV